MADNVGYTPGTGATIAADEIGGVLHQRVKVGVGEDGTATDVSESNPMPTKVYGELVDAIEALRMAVQSLTRTGMGLTMPDAQARMRVVLDAVTSGLALGSTTVTGTLTTVNTLTNQTTIGGNSAVDQIPALMRIAANGLRDNINVT
jgi:hypothetical protein